MISGIIAWPRGIHRVICLLRGALFNGSPVPNMPPGNPPSAPDSGRARYRLAAIFATGLLDRIGRACVCICAYVRARVCPAVSLTKGEQSAVMWLVCRVDGICPWWGISNRRRTRKVHVNRSQFCYEECDHFGKHSVTSRCSLRYWRVLSGSRSAAELKLPSQSRSLAL